MITVMASLPDEMGPESSRALAELCRRQRSGVDRVTGGMSREVAEGILAAGLIEVRGSQWRLTFEGSEWLRRFSGGGERL
jgi:hypothetical protein